MAAGCVNDGAELITDRDSYVTYILIYQYILTTLSGKLSQVQVTISPSFMDRRKKLRTLFFTWNLGPRIYGGF